MKKIEDEQIRNKLTKEQYRITRENGTQSPYKGKYYKCTKTGIYHCIVCQIPLFSSDHKYDSGSGWPAFFDQLQSANVQKIVDYRKNGKARTQVRCKGCDSHLGHIFNDGPKDKKGIRYCINSASLTLNEKK